MSTAEERRPVATSPAERWTDLTLREKNILEHLAGIYSGRAQTLVIEAGKPVQIQTTSQAHKAMNARYEVPTPTAEEVHRMTAFCIANADEITVLEQEAGKLVVRGPDCL